MPKPATTSTSNATDQYKVVPDKDHPTTGISLLALIIFLVSAGILFRDVLRRKRPGEALVMPKPATTSTSNTTDQYKIVPYKDHLTIGVSSLALIVSLISAVISGVAAYKQCLVTRPT